MDHIIADLLTGSQHCGPNRPVAQLESPPNASRSNLSGPESKTLVWHACTGYLKISRQQSIASIHHSEASNMRANHPLLPHIQSLYVFNPLLTCSCLNWTSSPAWTTSTWTKQQPMSKEHPNLKLHHHMLSLNYILMNQGLPCALPSHNHPISTLLSFPHPNLTFTP